MTPPDDSTFCACLQAQIQPWLDGALAPNETVFVEGHLALCPACRGAAEGWRQLWHLLADLPVVAPPETLRQRVLDRVSRSRAPPSRWGLRLSTASVLLLLATGGAFLASFVLVEEPMAQWVAEEMAQESLPMLTWAAGVAEGFVEAALGSPDLLGGLSLLLVGAGWGLLQLLPAGARPTAPAPRHSTTA